jgi:hypothetical protein
MSKSNVFENAFLELIFNGTAIANIADDAGTDPLTDLYVSLHTASPGEDGDQADGEADYTDYARVAVERSSSGWTVTDNEVVPAATIIFPECTGGTSDVTHFGIGTEAAGAGVLLYFGTVTPTLLISTGIQPQLGSGTTITED